MRRIVHGDEIVVGVLKDEQDFFISNSKEMATIMPIAKITGIISFIQQTAKALMLVIYHYNYRTH